tara:strand:+ start:5329 stop:5742 length:414 start_codon:yes stop_codon:yes gene_type:complete
LRSQICFPAWTSVDSNTDEYIIGLFGPTEFPDGFNKILWTLGHRRTAGAGTIAWKLKTQTDPYLGPVEVFDSDFQSFDGFSNTITTTSDSHVISHSFLNLPSSPLGSDFTYLILSATNSNGTTRGEITTLDMKPVLR